MQMPDVVFMIGGNAAEPAGIENAGRKGEVGKKRGEPIRNDTPGLISNTFGNLSYRNPRHDWVVTPGREITGKRKS